jgi:FkbM family methyltransferase
MGTAVKDVARSVVKSIPPIYRMYNRHRGWRIHDADSKIPYREFGGDGGHHNYGAWVVPDNLLNKDSIVYSIGIGEDISFDLDVIRHFGCQIFAYDPTPDAIAYIMRIEPDPRFIFHPIGLAAVDGVTPFAGSQGSDVSHTLPHHDNDFLHYQSELPVNRIETLMFNNDHHHIDLLKMDIEGFEYAVLDDMVSSKISPRCIILEFHHFQRRDPESTKRAVRALIEVGYQLFWVSDLGAEYGFYLST